MKHKFHLKVNMEQTFHVTWMPASGRRSRLSEADRPERRVGNLLYKQRQALRHSVDQMLDPPINTRVTGGILPTIAPN